MTPTFLVYVSRRFCPRQVHQRIFSLAVSEHAQRKEWPEEAGNQGVHRLTPPAWSGFAVFVQRPF